MSNHRATGRDVVLAVLENMKESLEPLVTETLAPSFFQVYLHRQDYEHLRTISQRIEVQAKQLLDQELERLNQDAVPISGKLLARLRRREPPAHGTMRYVRAGGGWRIQIDEDPNRELAEGEIEVICELAIEPAAQGLGSGSKTRRISTVKGRGTTRTHEEVVDSKAFARISYQDSDGPRTFLMTQDEIVIGRETEGGFWVDLRLKTYLDISREHARIKRDSESGRCFIKDLSKLGTTVDGQPVPCSHEIVQGETVDRDIWIRLPDRAKLRLADVVELEFERVGEP